MKNLFVDYQIALQAKGLGYDEKCMASYDNNAKFNPPYLVNEEDLNEEDFYVQNSELPTPSNWCSAPLYQQITDWLRESHGLQVSIIPSELEQGKWYYHRFDLHNKERDSEPELVRKYDTYYEALQQGIINAFKLIT